MQEIVVRGCAVTDGLKAVGKQVQYRGELWSVVGVYLARATDGSRKLHFVLRSCDHYDSCSRRGPKRGFRTP
jgi:hypothetical protein